MSTSHKPLRPRRYELCYSLVSDEPGKVRYLTQNSQIVKNPGRRSRGDDARRGFYRRCHRQTSTPHNLSSLQLTKPLSSHMICHLHHILLQPQLPPFPNSPSPKHIFKSFSVIIPLTLNHARQSSRCRPHHRRDRQLRSS